uniref:Uncharacterized protein n=1 Tax=Arundo donax TaxID=35708 RepID=A0A0A8ZBW3_ARUDO
MALILLINPHWSYRDHSYPF